jgi:PEP-CTERM motif
MMRMSRRLTVLFSLAAGLAVPSLAGATTVTLNDYTGSTAEFMNNAPNGGGPYTATTAGGGTLGNRDFITFCLEFNEHFSYGGTYDYTLSDSARNGGVSGGNPDPVDNATKWIYAELLTGGYSSIAAFGSGDVGGRVQEAVWFIEGEREKTDISDASFALANYALAHQTWSKFSAKGYQVYAMNLTNPDGSPAQDQLAMTSPAPGTTTSPVPEPATLVLFGSGLLFTSRQLIRRKKRS